MTGRQVNTAVYYFKFHLINYNLRQKKEEEFIDTITLKRREFQKYTKIHI